MTERIKWFGPELGTQEREKILAVLDSGYINDGEVTRELETQIAQLVGAKFCVAVTSGTAAISLALFGLSVGPGDEVIVPDITFVATANAAVMIGAQVRLVDVKSNDFTIDPDQVASAIGPQTRAVVAVDVNGRGCDYARLENVCRDAGIPLICDSAEALGSRSAEKSLGTYGTAGIYSFSANKTVTAGQGGTIVTDDEALYSRLRELKDQGRRNGGTGGNDLHPVIGFNFKLTNLQAAIAIAQLARLPERLEGFLRRDKLFQNALEDYPDIKFPPMSAKGEIRQWTDILSPRRDEIFTALSERGIGSRPFWIPIHRQHPYAANDADFPNAAEISNHGLWLPSNYSLTEAQIDQTAAVIRSVTSES